VFPEDAVTIAGETRTTPGGFSVPLRLVIFARTADESK
jgi:hypothetical protein